MLKKTKAVHKCALVKLVLTIQAAPADPFHSCTILAGFILWQLHTLTTS